MNYNILLIKTQIFNIVIADFYIFAPFLIFKYFNNMNKKKIWKQIRTDGTR